MPESKERPTDVERLVIWGRPGWYMLHWRNAEGKLINVDASRYGADLTMPNSFRLVRDAKAAAKRLDGVLPWSQDDLGIKAMTLDEQRALRIKIVEALTGKSQETLEREYRERREARERVYRGDWARDNLERTATQLGHDAPLRRNGQRSWIGKCSKCKQTLRASYQSMSGGYTFTTPQCARK